MGGGEVEGGEIEPCDERGFAIDSFPGEVGVGGEVALFCGFAWRCFCRC